MNSVKTAVNKFLQQEEEQSVGDCAGAWSAWSDSTCIPNIVSIRTPSTRALCLREDGFFLGFMSQSIEKCPPWWNRWWVREIIKVGRVIRPDVRSAAINVWDNVCDVVAKIRGDTTEAPEILDNAVAVVSVYLRTPRVAASRVWPDSVTPVGRPWKTKAPSNNPLRSSLPARSLALSAALRSARRNCATSRSASRSGVVARTQSERQASARRLSSSSEKLVNQTIVFFSSGSVFVSVNKALRRAVKAPGSTASMRN